MALTMVASEHDDGHSQGHIGLKTLTLRHFEVKIPWFAFNV